MTDYCEELDGWDDMSREDKEQFLSDLINDEREAQGLPPVDVTFESEPDKDGDGESDYWGSWDEDSNTVNIDDSAVDSGSAKDVVGTALHEATHAEQDAEFEDEYWDEAYQDDEGVYQMFEDDADAYADAWFDSMEEGCEEPEPPESSADGDMPPDW